MPGKTVDDLVVTPGGYRHTSHVHAIGPGHRLDLARGTIQQMDARGHLVNNFGPLQIKSSGKPLMPGNVSRHPTLDRAWRRMDRLRRLDKRYRASGNAVFNDVESPSCAKNEPQPGHLPL